MPTKKPSPSRTSPVEVSKNVNDSVATPRDLYEQLNREFRFSEFDPAPLRRPAKFDGLAVKWPKCTFVNPPFSSIQPWVEKAIKEHELGKTVVMLLTARVSSKYWQDLVFENATEIRFLAGKICFEGQKGSGLPTPIAIVVFQGNTKTYEVPQKYLKYSYASVIVNEDDDYDDDDDEEEEDDDDEEVDSSDSD
jgi:hypothetical protein